MAATSQEICSVSPEKFTLSSHALTHGGQPAINPDVMDGYGDASQYGAQWGGADVRGIFKGRFMILYFYTHTAFF